MQIQDLFTVIEFKDMKVEFPLYFDFDKNLFR